MAYRPHLRRTVTIALVVGTILFCINQLDVVVRGDATAIVWIKSAVTYVVPFCVANAGVLVATRHDRQTEVPETAVLKVTTPRGDQGTVES